MPVCLQLSNMPEHPLLLPVSQICFACVHDFATGHGSTGAAETADTYSDRADAIAKTDFFISFLQAPYRGFCPRYKPEK
jgi:hypothetical protein